MSAVAPIQPHERYIAIGGESWAAALGTQQAKYLTPKVGIFLYGADGRDLRDQVEGMAFMSANSSMAMHPLLQIMDVLQDDFDRFAGINQRYKSAATEFRKAVSAVKKTSRLLEEARK